MFFWVLLSVFFLLLWLVFRPRNAVAGIPGPHPFFNTLYLPFLPLLGGSTLGFVDQCWRKYGPVWSMYIPGLGGCITTLNAEDVEHILSSNFDNFQRLSSESKATPWRFRKFLGHGIFAANGKAWYQQRNAARSYFTVQSIAEYVPIFEQKAVEMSNLLAKAALKKQPVDLQDFFFRFTLDSFGLLGFGFDFNSLMNEDLEFPRLFDKLQKRVDETFRSLMNNLPDKEFSENLAKLDSVMYGLIAKRKTENYHEKIDLLSRFMKLVDDNGKPYDDDWLRDIL